MVLDEKDFRIFLDSLKSDIDTCFVTSPREVVKRVERFIEGVRLKKQKDDLEKLQALAKSMMDPGTHGPTDILLSREQAIKLYMKTQNSTREQAEAWIDTIIKAGEMR